MKCSMDIWTALSLHFLDLYHVKNVKVVQKFKGIEGHDQRAVVPITERACNRA
jgi:hypothetical protein